MNLKCILLCELSQPERLYTVYFQLFGIWKRKNHGKSKKISGYQGMEGKWD